MKIKLILVIVSLQSILSSQELLDTTIYLSKKQNTIVLKNNDSTEVSFYLKINDFFPFTIFSIVDSIKQLSSHSKDYYEAWRFISNNTEHTVPYSSKSWQHDPALFINSVGSGFCDDRASVLVRIWKELGYDARVMGISGHVISEVFNDGKWKMLDPDLRIYYTKNDTILSVSELENNPDIIRKGILIGRSYADYYESKEDNTDNTAWHLDYNDWDTNMILPSYAKLSFIQCRKKNTIHVNVPTGINGTIKLPFVPVFIKGHGKVSVNHAIIEVDGLTMLPRDKPMQELNIIENIEGLDVYYLFNDKIEFMDSSISVKILSGKGVSIKGQRTRLSKKLLKKLSFWK